MNKEGINGRSKIVLSQQKINEIQEFYDSGKTLLECKNHFKLSKELITRNIKVRHRTKLQAKQKAERNYNGVRDWLRNTKRKLVEYKGGKCILCGYNKYVGALHFHHINPSSKEFEVTERIRAFERMKKESDKCVILCANCHAEVHAGISSITGSSLNG